MTEKPKTPPNLRAVPCCFNCLHAEGDDGDGYIDCALYANQMPVWGQGQADVIHFQIGSDAICDDHEPQT